jgi:hypothetical protein
MRETTEPTSTEYAARRRAERRVDRRVLVPALLVSVLIHAFVFRFSIEPPPEYFAPPPPFLVNVEPAMRVHNITPVQTEAAPIDVQVMEREIRREALSPDAPWVVPPPGSPPPPTEGAAVRDRLRYRMGSAEVWRPHADPHGDVMTPDEVVRARVAAELDAFNDSVAAEAAARARALDWTTTDSEGRRWGVSPGKIHLGGISLPLPVEFRPPPGRREEATARVRSWTEIQAQAARVETEATINERARLIRERAERERNGLPPDSAGRGSTNGSGGSHP